MGIFKSECLRILRSSPTSMRSRIEKLLRRELQRLQFAGAELHLLDTDTVETRVAKRLLEQIFQGRVTIKLVANSKTNSKRATKRKHPDSSAPRFQATSLENELCRELHNFLEDEWAEPAATPLLATVPEAEIRAYAERHGLLGDGRFLAPQDDVRDLLERLQEQQPQTKAAMRKSFEHLRNAPKKKAKDL